ncbi:hypothetical protein [Actinomadura flavalba]|uniref:hypothetical protein n=1 Tax=Actinomadura flavalba TaxID=1120938 RepID=UPI0003AAA9EB|nr:hypothetical protein [Actinomadura flavalba]
MGLWKPWLASTGTFVVGSVVAVIVLVAFAEDASGGSADGSVFWNAVATGAVFALGTVAAGLLTPSRVRGRRRHLAILAVPVAMLVLNLLSSAFTAAPAVTAATSITAAVAVAAAWWPFHLAGRSRARATVGDGYF